MKEKKILLSHGSGGKLSYRLIRDLFVSNFENDYLKRLDDGAILKINDLNLAFSTDSYTEILSFFKVEISVN